MTIAELINELDKLIKEKGALLNSEIKVCFNKEPFPLNFNGFSDVYDNTVYLELVA